MIYEMWYNGRMSLSPATVFGAAMKAGASDLHLAAGSPMLLRIDGILRTEGDVLSPGVVEKFVQEILEGDAWKRLEQ